MSVVNWLAESEPSSSSGALLSTITEVVPPEQIVLISGAAVLAACIAIPAIHGIFAGGISYLTFYFAPTYAALNLLYRFRVKITETISEFAEAYLLSNINPTILLWGGFYSCQALIMVWGYMTSKQYRLVKKLFVAFAFSLILIVVSGIVHFYNVMPDLKQQHEK